jgi:putative hemolysin
MIDTIVFWNLLILSTLVFQAFFIMLEMASLSANRIRIAYLSSKNERWATRLNFLLARPYRLFGTVMIGANLALQLHSFFARSFYTSIGIEPDWAPFLEIAMIVLFAELIPSIIGRTKGLTIAKWGVPTLYFFYRLFSPLIFACTLVTRIKYIIKRKEWKRDIPSLSAEELPELLSTTQKKEPFEILITNFFQLHEKEVRIIAYPLHYLYSAESHMKVQEALKSVPKGASYILVREKGVPSGIIKTAELLQSHESISLKSIQKELWVLQGSLTVRRALTMFKSHQQELAIVKNEKNIVVGFLTLEALLNELTSSSAA